MHPMTIALWLLSLCFVALFGYLIYVMVTGGKRADIESSSSPRKHRWRKLPGRGSEPDMVAISPTEIVKVKKV